LRINRNSGYRARMASSNHLVSDTAGTRPVGLSSQGGVGKGAARRSPPRKLSPFWSRQFHFWHWTSSAICLVGLLLFAFTGITLNHAADIAAEPVVTTTEEVMPESLLRSLRHAQATAEPAVPASVADWSQDVLDVDMAGRAPEWSEQELYVPLPRPGGDGWVAFDLQTGGVIHERTDRGWISWLNDLHKGRDAGTAWRWFIDIFAAACFIFALSGFLLLWLHARKRRSTWPLVGAGLVIPMLLVILFMNH
jgi:hypothetical protein